MVTIGPEGAVDDPVGDGAHLGSLAHRRALDEGKGVLLGHLALVHQNPLRPVDRLAGFELLAEGVDLAGERAEFPEAADRHLDGRHEVGLLERLDEVGQGTGVAGILDDLSLAEGGEDQHAAELLLIDQPGDLEAVLAGHLDVEDRQVGQQLADELDRPIAVAGLADDLVALLLERLAQVHPDDRLVLGDHDTDRHNFISCSAPRSAVRADHLGAVLVRSSRP